MHAPEDRASAEALGGVLVTAPTGTRWNHSSASFWKRRICSSSRQNPGSTARPYPSQVPRLDPAGLIADLKRTGLLDSTLVVWCGEFETVAHAFAFEKQVTARQAGSAALAAARAACMLAWSP